MSWQTRTPWPQVRFFFDGREYRWSGWFGSQLESLEWRTLPAGTQRVLHFANGEESVRLTVFSTVRRGLKVSTHWAVSSCGTHDEHTARIWKLKKDLANLV